MIFARTTAKQSRCVCSNSSPSAFVHVIQSQCAAVSSHVDRSQCQAVPGHMQRFFSDFCALENVQVLQGRRRKSMGEWEIQPLVTPKPLNRSSPTLHTWLSPGCLPTSTIWSRSLKGFLFPVCAKLRINDVYSASFCSGSFKCLQPRPLNGFSRVIYVKRRGSVQGCAFLDKVKLRL